MPVAVKRFALPSLLLCLAGCGGGERIEGMELTLGLTTARARGVPEAAGARTLVTDEGARATLFGALVTLGSVELIPCETTGWRRLWNELSPVGTAWAHSVSNALRLGTPHVVALGATDGEVVSLGVMRPPPGRYCRARLTFEPADSDAEGLSSASQGAVPVDMLGLSLHVRGTLADGERDFEVETRGRSSVDVVLDGLELTEDAPKVARVFTLAWDSWLDGVGPGESPRNVDLLGNVARSASLQSAVVP
ncbi:hypothetical protein HUA74_06890 [Myxococcus sp. CA051A]|uniref:hypothetical protein n=1 Tax=Myxococcus sp. CA051A TaxID=2741739 RepID=UPI00157A47D6|nr:hypothetical protein [Myxococcus sp. CA051A]NTX60382.1 hypothetical protein [Myxococcus sp. CA051A]